MCTSPLATHRPHSVGTAATAARGVAIHAMHNNTHTHRVSCIHTYAVNTHAHAVACCSPKKSCSSQPSGGTMPGVIFFAYRLQHGDSLVSKGCGCYCASAAGSTHKLQQQRCSCNSSYSQFCEIVAHCSSKHPVSAAAAAATATCVAAIAEASTAASAAAVQRNGPEKGLPYAWRQTSAQAAAAARPQSGLERGVCALSTL
jgi:hypothetical protein